MGTPYIKRDPYTQNEREVLERYRDEEYTIPERDQWSAAHLVEALAWMGQEDPDRAITLEELRLIILRWVAFGQYPAEILEDRGLPVPDAYADDDEEDEDEEGASEEGASEEGASEEGASEGGEQAVPEDLDTVKSLGEVPLGSLCTSEQWMRGDTFVPVERRLDGYVACRIFSGPNQGRLCTAPTTVEVAIIGPAEVPGATLPLGMVLVGSIVRQRDGQPPSFAVTGHEEGAVRVREVQENGYISPTLVYWQPTDQVYLEKLPAEK